jgi:hypothetical protein
MRLIEKRIKQSTIINNNVVLCDFIRFFCNMLLLLPMKRSWHQRSSCLLLLPYSFVAVFSFTILPSHHNLCYYHHQIHTNPIPIPYQILLDGKEIYQRKGFHTIHGICIQSHRNSILWSTLSSSPLPLVSSHVVETVLTTTDEFLFYLNQETQDKQIVDQYMEILEQPYRQMQQDYVNDSMINHNRTVRANSTVNENSIDIFQSLLGWYDVKYVKTSRPNDNPVGGKWTRKNPIQQNVLRLIRTYQHLLPPNTTGIGSRCIIHDHPINETTIIPVVAEAINVLVFQALWGFWNVFVILRGDAIALTEEERCRNMMTIPRNDTHQGRYRDKNRRSLDQKTLFVLSPFAVRALFDSPRIIVTSTNKKANMFHHNIQSKSSHNRSLWMNFILGPKSSVVLDTSYIDHSIRIGVGGRSGTRFVFQKCVTPTDMEQANEFQSLLQRPPWNQQKIILSLASIIIFNTVVAWKQTLMPLRVLSSSIACMSSIISFLILFSSGGIEDRPKKVR